MTVMTREKVLWAGLVAIGKAGSAHDAEFTSRPIAEAKSLLPPNYPGAGFIKPDTSDAVFFYEQDFYVLSNFSAFAVSIFSRVFPTAEHAYHYAKFLGVDGEVAAKVRAAIAQASSAHNAHAIAHMYEDVVRGDWLDVRDAAMREVVVAKTRQHEYVMRKLVATGHRRLIEDSWRDDYWGWGPERKGLNRLGEIWEGVRHDVNAGLITPDVPVAVNPAEMTLAEFAAAEHAKIDDFVNAWLRGNEGDSDAFPDAMSRQDWEARFTA